MQKQVLQQWNPIKIRFSYDTEPEKPINILRRKYIKKCINSTRINKRGEVHIFDQIGLWQSASH